MKLSPKSEALAYRIWAYCEPRGWNVTVAEIAEGIETPQTRVQSVVGHKGWAGRLRATVSRQRTRTAFEIRGHRLDPIDGLHHYLASSSDLSDLAIINA